MKTEQEQIIDPQLFQYHSQAPTLPPRPNWDDGIDLTSDSESDVSGYYYTDDDESYSEYSG